MVSWYESIVRMDARRQGVIATAVSVGRLHIVAIAALGCFTFGWLFTGHRPWAVTAVCALDWFLVNLLNRVVDVKEDDANGIAGTELVVRHRRGGLAYNWRIFGGRRIKQLYFWKNAASATGFLLTVFAYPLAWARGQLGFGIS